MCVFTDESIFLCVGCSQRSKLIVVEKHGSEGGEKGMDMKAVFEENKCES